MAWLLYGLGAMFTFKLMIDYVDMPDEADYGIAGAGALLWPILFALYVAGYELEREED